MDAILANISAFTGDTGHRQAKLQLSKCSKVNSKRKCCLGIICFSKDRPYQLHQLLLSIKAKLIGEYHINFCEETSFYDDLNRCLHSLFDAKQATHVMFCVDDMIFIRQTDVMQAMDMLERESDVFALQLKLHPGITYSHAASKACPPPELQVISNVAATSTLPGSATGFVMFLKYHINSGLIDWRYPFDLCGAIYRLCDAQSILADCQPFDNPNTLEYQGNTAYWKSSLASKYSSCACVASPTALVITVNRVQDVYEVPIYEHSADYSLQQLNQLIDYPADQIPRLDLERYYNSSFSSVHIGDIWFAKDVTATSNVAGSQVTVLIPVHNGAAFLADCINSVLQSNQQHCNSTNLSTSFYSILVVDDGSADNSSRILQSLQPLAAQQGVSMQVLTLDQQEGLPSALDKGLLAIETEFVARLDADDLCLPGRLKRQLEYLQANPSIHVLGTQAALLNQGEQQSVTSVKTHPLMVLLALYFRCPLLHPTVMFRRQSIIEAGGYSAMLATADQQPPAKAEEVATSAAEEARMEGRKFVEDYDLWMRIAKMHPYGLSNLPDVTIQLRLHEQSKSSKEKEQVLAASRQLRIDLLSSTLLSSTSEPMLWNEVYVHAITHPQSQLHHLMCEQLPNVLDTLESIYSTFYRSAFLPYYGNYNADEVSCLPEEGAMVWASMQAGKQQQLRSIITAAVAQWGEHQVRSSLDAKYLSLIDEANCQSLRESIWKQLV